MTEKTIADLERVTGESYKIVRHVDPVGYSVSVQLTKPPDVFGNYTLNGYGSTLSAAIEQALGELAPPDGEG